ncbi:hypothetical protein ACRQ5Q_42810 (plasmid) [Bradyrhizobium sp. PMVTL-01]|uniref:hypothetical protein n=1 Tax=Bradyrhizobium sp. PMVTL-01 TaxID=3434999 RepID=UPI003F703C6D
MDIQYIGATVSFGHRCFRERLREIILCWSGGGVHAARRSTCCAADDLRQARELALLICKSEEAIESFLKHCDVAARDLLMPYGDLLIVLSSSLRIKRTLDGSEIDEIISDVVTRKAMAIERKRRTHWRKREDEATSFRAMCEPLRAVTQPR